ncbi:FUSC family protein [uncultured Pseudomonas sp.]|uniref:FUSC family protein n=2 Tax=uncultured Pseudomonas sp. TaxID=114707 RepID=UPI00258624EC|nr:FUSC family protein [uncultured Pseudomonas sp.]
MSPSQALSEFRQLLRDLAGDLRQFGRDRRRLVDELETLTSVLLAILLGHLAGVQHVGWAAFSGYIVMRSDVRDSFSRGCLRVLGTCIGAAGALLVLRHLQLNPYEQAVLLGTVGSITLYLTLVGRYGYAWLLGGLTYAMVVLASLQAPDQLEQYALSRLLEVALGTSACVLVSALSTYGVRARLWPKVPTTVASTPRTLGVWQPLALRHALQGGLALALLSLGATAEIGVDVSQAAITILAVMVVPFDGLSSAGKAVSRRLLHRMLGCLLGGGLAALLLLVSQESLWLTLAGVALGVLIGRHLENGPLGIGYLGMQFALAFLVVMVPDHYDHIDPVAGMARLGGILLGFLVLEPVYWLSTWLIRRLSPGSP